jgi:thiol:disulfide interchange protein
MGMRRPSRETTLWAFVITVLLIMQWPMIKGTWYKHLGGPPPPSAIAWHSDLATALAEARRTDRHVLVDVTASWCPPCITMKHEVWPDADVAAAVQDRYVAVRIDVDRQPEVAARYEVGGIPDVFVLDADGTVLRRASFLSVGGMTQFLLD